MPSAAALILSTLAFDILVSSAAVGIAFFVILRRFRFHLAPKVVVPALLGVFAFLDLVWWPAAIASSATFTIHNNELAAFFSLGPNTPVDSLLDLGLIDVLGWFIQAGVALWVSHRLHLDTDEAAV